MIPKRRTIIRLTTFLLLGAAVNVAVAWGFALCVPQYGGYSTAPIEHPMAWPTYLEGTWPQPTIAYEVVSFPVRNIGASRFVIKSVDDRGAPVGNGILLAYVEINQFGMPMRSLQWEGPGLNATSHQAGIKMLAAAADAAGWRKGIRLSRDKTMQEFDDRRVPLTPIWPGFAINTIFYAAVLGLLSSVPWNVRKHRRRRRIKRGLCPACAYPVGASAVCTECGTPRPVSRLGSLESQRREPA